MGVWCPRQTASSQKESEILNIYKVGILQVTTVVGFFSLLRPKPLLDASMSFFTGKSSSLTSSIGCVPGLEPLQKRLQTLTWRI